MTSLNRSVVFFNVISRSIDRGVSHPTNLTGLAHIQMYIKKLYIQLFDVHLNMCQDISFENLNRCDPSTCISGKVQRISRLTANIFRKYLSPFKVTDSQLSILFIITKSGGLSQKEITQMIKLEKSSLSRNLKRLLEKEYVTKQDFPMLKITDAGKKLVNDIIPEWEKAMHEIQNLLGPSDTHALDAILQKLNSKT